MCHAMKLSNRIVKVQISSGWTRTQAPLGSCATLARGKMKVFGSQQSAPHGNNLCSVVTRGSVDGTA